MAGIPLSDKEAVVFVLYSIHDVMKAEFKLKENRMTYDVIPVPKEISSDCGMALMVLREEEGKVREIFGRNNLNVKGIFLKTPDGYEEWSDEGD